MVGSPRSPRDSQESSPTPQFKSINSSVLSFLYIQLSHPHTITGKTIALTRQTFVSKVMSLLFNTLSWHNFSSKEQVSFNFMAAIIICHDFGAQENKVCHCFHCFPSICHEVMGLDAMIFVFFFTLLSLSSRGSLVPLHFLP